MSDFDSLETLLNMMPDRTSKTNVLTPVRIAKEMVNALPQDIWNSRTKFLDIACKSGIFLYEIQKKLMKAPSLIKEFPDAKARRQHILKNQLYGIAMDGFSQLITIRTVYGHLTPDNNISCIDGYLNKIKTQTYAEFKKTLEKEFKQEMKFDVVVGNPPYNNDLYLDFVKKGHLLSKVCTMMITPAKWQAKGGKKNEEFREQIVPYMSKIVYYPDCSDVFEIGEVGGITYYVIEKTKQKEHEISEVCLKNAKLNCKGSIKNFPLEPLDIVGDSIIKKTWKL